MAMNKRKSDRVHFERGYEASIMGIDGTWQRRCLLEDVSPTGAKLMIEGAVGGLNLKEFFLVLSRVGNAYRRCELIWIKGDTIGLRFLRSNPAADNGERPKRRLRFADRQPDPA